MEFNDAYNIYAALLARAQSKGEIAALYATTFKNGEQVAEEAAKDAATCARLAAKFEKIMGVR